MRLRVLYAYDGAPTPLVSTDEVARAVNLTAAHAHDADDLRHLLDVLGVADHEGTTT